MKSNKGLTFSLSDKMIFKVVGGEPVCYDATKDFQLTSGEFIIYEKEYHNARHNIAIDADARESIPFKHFYLGCVETQDYICNLFASAKSVDIVLHLIRDVNPISNKAKCTYRKISKEAHVSTSTISKTFKILRGHNLAKFHSGYIFLSPKIARRTGWKNYIRIYNNFYKGHDDWWKDPKHNNEYSAGEYMIFDNEKNMK